MKKLIRRVLSFFITMTCFGSIYFLHTAFFEDLGNECFIAALGAAAVLTFSNSEASNYKAKNMFLGSILGAAIGVFFNGLFIDKTVAIVLAISCCVFLMEIMRLKYPPGGAMALIPFLENEAIQDLGYLFIVYPVLTGIGLIFIFSNIQKTINNKL